MKSFHTVEPAYFDLAGAAAYTGGALGVRTLRRLIARPGGLPYHQAGRGKSLIKKSDLDNYLERFRHEPLDLDALADQAVAELKGLP
jgi:excisionase family DNA binding protein